MSLWMNGVTKVLVTISEILTAGIAVTAFSLLLYALSFNLRNRVARSFALILVCVVIVFSAEALGSTATNSMAIDYWLHIQWVGILFLPASYFHFSDALLATTGRPSRWRRRWAVRIAYIISFVLLCLLPTDLFLGEVVVNEAPVPFNRPTLITELFTIYYLVIMFLSWINYVRAMRRTVTETSHRRMTYLGISAAAPALGCFPFLLYSSSFASDQALLFWLMLILVNLLVGALIVGMAYSVAFFGVSWPDRVVKSRLIKWLLRGPVTASLTLALVTIVRRAGDVLGGNPYTALVPIVMIVTILLSEFMITLFFPKLEQWLLFGNDQTELLQLRALEERLLTRSDLSQFLEMVLAAICDQLQAPGAYIVSKNSDDFDLVIQTGNLKDLPDLKDQFQDYLEENTDLTEMSVWQKDVIFPLIDGGDSLAVVGYLGIHNIDQQMLLEGEVMASVNLLLHRAAIAVRDRAVQEQMFRTLEQLDPQVDMIQQLRAAGRYDRQAMLLDDQAFEGKEMTSWIKDALTHYWGGPKLTENPLLQLHVVQSELKNHENNGANALRSILKQAIEKLRPDGERKYTGEWILYNILDLKFLEGKKVREIAMRLAVSEADLYRKQRVAIDAVANEIVHMEVERKEQENSEEI
ncbi:MAG: histidine kinase N-terminal 7TM domain-containing protein [Anaerolineaceae bacterium]|nr:histidine kinase N-terminal 7TM domain-containing protein [Anaerolineaceae bacterium]